MSAYRLGLTAKAAAWTVRQQKGHRHACETAMISLEAGASKTNNI